MWRRSLLRGDVGRRPGPSNQLVVFAVRAADGGHRDAVPWTYGTIHVLSTGSEIRDFRVNQRRQKTETAGET